jgi:hypothetical protein
MEKMRCLETSVRNYRYTLRVDDRSSNKRRVSWGGGGGNTAGRLHRRLGGQAAADRGPACRSVYFKRASLFIRSACIHLAPSCTKIRLQPDLLKRNYCVIREVPEHIFTVSIRSTCGCVLKYAADPHQIQLNGATSQSACLCQIYTALIKIADRFLFLALSKVNHL